MILGAWLAALLLLVGAGLLAAGAAWMWGPVALLVAGGILIGCGLFAVDVGGRRR